MLRILRDAGLILLVGIPLSLLINATSPRGLSLSRDYFYSQSTPRPPDSEIGAGPEIAESTVVDVTPVPPGPGIVPSTKTADPLRARLEAAGLGLLTHNEAAALHPTEAYAQGRIVFIDARDITHFQEGHIPGAYRFDHYRMEETVGEVLPVCLVADQVVVYCNGGTCEDSEFAAHDLVELGVNPGQVFVYAGGITEWKSKGMPIERGTRQSGDISTPTGKKLPSP